MNDRKPSTPFLDRAWWQAVTSNAVGSALGTGLVLLIGVSIGVFQSPDGLRWTVTILVFLFAALCIVLTGVMMLRDPRKVSRRFISVWWWLGVIFALVCSTIVIVTTVVRG